jgi:glycosyltransferase involved in cell wall biosynthesis
LNNNLGNIRVLHCIPGYSTGGIESLFRELVTRSDRSKVQLDLIVEGTRRHSDFDRYAKFNCRIHEIKRSRTRNTLAYLRELNDFFLESSSKYDILHNHTPVLGAIYGYFARRHGLPVRIAHSHTTGTDSAIDGLKLKIMAPVYMRSHTHYLACSKRAGEFLWPNKQVDYQVLPNGIDLSRFRFDPVARQKVRRQLGCGELLIIGHAGRFARQKNHEFLIDIFSEILKNKKALLVLAGDGPLEQTIRIKVKALGIEDNVKFLGARDDVPTLMNGFDVFVLPSHYEGFGIVALEAQANGLPCVLSDTTPADVMATPGVCALSLKKSAAEWARIVIDAASDTGNSRQPHAELECFDIGAITKQLESYYRQWTPKTNRSVTNASP